MLRRFAPRNDTNRTKTKRELLKPFDTTVDNQETGNLDTNRTKTKRELLKPFDTTVDNQETGNLDTNF